MSNASTDGRAMPSHAAPSPPPPSLPQRSTLMATLRANVGTLAIDVAFDTGAGVLAVVGPNGAGKSSLLKLMLGALPAVAGRVAIDAAVADERVVLYDSVAGIDVALGQRQLGWVPQGLGLMPHLNVRANLDFAVRYAAPTLTRSDRADAVDHALQQLDLAALAHRYIGDLSGGECQRVALARALAWQPRALLLDEPLSALDVHRRRALRAVLAEHLQRLAIPTVVVTHDFDDAIALADRVAVLEAGKITQYDGWRALVASPETAFVRELVAGR
jgi:molybdate transport system ATP-binding protein